MVLHTQTPLSNVQLELLKLYSTGISDKHLLELKELLSSFLFEKAKNMADDIWEQKGYNDQTIQQWLNED